jgi:hypothetical protein
MLRRIVAPVLRNSGFEYVAARNAWAWPKDCVWVFTIRAVGWRFVSSRQGCIAPGFLDFLGGRLLMGRRVAHRRAGSDFDIYGFVTDMTVIRVRSSQSPFDGRTWTPIMSNIFGGSQFSLISKRTGDCGEIWFQLQLCRFRHLAVPPPGIGSQTTMRGICGLMRETIS